MATTDAAFTFDPEIPSSTSRQAYHANSTIQNFTATGRPFNPSRPSHGSGLVSLGGAESISTGTLDPLPRRYNDDSLISIAVLPPQDLNPACATPTSASNQISPHSFPVSFLSIATINDDEGPVKHDKASSGLKFWRHKRSSSSFKPAPTSNPTSKWRASKKRDSFVMKSVTRGEYLKFYAKDNEGRFIGTERPASDCILRVEADRVKWRSGPGEWKNDI